MTIRIFARPLTPIQAPTAGGASLLPAKVPYQVQKKYTPQQLALLRDIGLKPNAVNFDLGKFVGGLKRSSLKKYLHHFFGKPRDVVAMPDSLKAALVQAQRIHFLRQLEIRPYTSSVRKAVVKFPRGYIEKYPNPKVELRDEAGRLFAKIYFENGSFRIQRILHDKVEKFSVSELTHAMANQLNIDLDSLRSVGAWAKAKPNTIIRIKNSQDISVAAIHYSDGHFHIQTPPPTPRIRVLSISVDGYVRKFEADREFIELAAHNHVLIQIAGYAGGNPIHFVPPPRIAVDDVRAEFDAGEELTRQPA